MPDFKGSTELFMAGVLKPHCIHWVCFDSQPDKPGWTPYKALAERWSDRSLADTAAQAAHQRFKVGGTPVVMTEREALDEY